ncbi:MAG: ATP synthase F1 subunit epsilon [Thermostichales cyanobacterium SZTDM-1c_bins_54]
MTLTVRVITPGKVVWDAPADEVILPATSGSLGILTGHAPLLTALGTGVMRVKVENQWTSIAVMGGFAEVEANEVSVLVNRAERGDTINLQQAKSEQAAAEKALETATDKQAKLQAQQELLRAKALVQAAELTQSP